MNAEKRTQMAAENHHLHSGYVKRRHEHREFPSAAICVRFSAFICVPRFSHSLLFWDNGAIQNRELPMKRTLAAILAAICLPAAAQLTLFSQEGFQGRSFSADKPFANLEQQGFNDRASSAIVRGGRYEVCSDRRFEGRCVVLRPGQYASLGAMGLNDRVSSVRPVGRQARVEEPRYAPPPTVVYDYRRRGGERLFEADVTAVRAVYGRPEQRCWVERERVASGEANVPAAIAGAVIGGILGHQVGGGRGQDLATAGGAVAGAALGANYGRDDRGTTFTRDVRRCEQIQGSSRPEYWDVTYRFRGVDRYVQLTRAPGRTITVNAQGEPRA
jgi:uncharacterized protein YcfJ